MASGPRGGPPPSSHPPLIGLPEDMDLPPLSIASQPRYDPGPPPPWQASQYSQQQLDFLTMSGTITLGNGIQVGRGGVREQPMLDPRMVYASPYVTSTPPTPSREAGDSVDCFEDLEMETLLGRGAGGQVRLAQHLRTGRRYAVKDIQVGLDERARADLGTELHISRKVTSAHVVQCYNAFYRDGHIFLVLEYMDGGSVADLLSSLGCIAECYLAEIARQALMGFVDLHSRAIIHRDIKPSNLLLNSQGQLKISDFGVSRVLEHSSDVGHTFAGTYTYMSPERIGGEKYNFSSDIWALGLTLLECATGCYPYGNSQEYFTLLRVVSNSEPPSAPPDTSPDFRDFISRCLQKNPSNRWSAQQLLDHPFLQNSYAAPLTELLTCSREV